MGAFELQETTLTQHEPMASTIPQPLKDECLIAFKVYDSCRNQNCLTSSEIGPARTEKGEIIKPPKVAASVTIDQLRIKRIIIVDKQPSAFKNGYWDIDIEYVFEYRLTFREVGGKVIHDIKGRNTFSTKVTLFGSVGTDLVVGTDLLSSFSESITFDSEPFIWAEAKAVALDARILRSRHHGEDEHHHGEVQVTIGLFSVIKLFRLVHLNVQSKGFCVPDECNEGNPICPCEYFEELDFPLDIFTPPQKLEHLSGTSMNIPKKKEG